VEVAKREKVCGERQVPLTVHISTLIACRSFDRALSNVPLSNACSETVGGGCSRREWLGKAANVPLMQIFLLFILQKNMVRVYCGDGLSDSHGDRHGPLSDCPIQIAEKLVIEYMESSEVSPKRKTMEQRYGRKNLKKLVAKHVADRATREWLEKSTMACPSCHVHVEKSMGCNHVSGSALHLP
jgi:hypothetical protein